MLKFSVQICVGADHCPHLSHRFNEQLSKKRREKSEALGTQGSVTAPKPKPLPVKPNTLPNGRTSAYSYILSIF